MSEVYFTTNPADWEALPGLYISERNPPGFIRGEPLSVVGFVGKCVRGPEKVVEITNPARFVEIFGERDAYDGGPFMGEVWWALVGRRFGKIAVRRVVAADAVLATLTFDDDSTPVLRVDASSKGSWGNQINAEVEAASDGDSDHFNLRVTYRGQVVVYENLDISEGNNNLEAVVGSDEARFVTLVKLADGRPDNDDGDLEDGADGTLTAAHYNDPLDDMAAHPGVHAVLVPEITPTQATTNAKMVALAPTVHDRVFLLWGGVHGATKSAEITALGAHVTTRSDRLVWCYNSGEQRDPVTGALRDVAPNIIMASILSGTDVDIHPGAADNARFAASLRSVKKSFSRGDLIDLRNAGVSVLTKTRDGFVFNDAVTTSLVTGKTQLTRRRMTDFLQLSASRRLVDYVKERNTRINRATMGGELVAFSQELMDAGRVIEQFSIDQESVNTESSRARGTERLFWRVRLIGHMLAVVLETEIGTGVTIEAQ